MSSLKDVTLERAILCRLSLEVDELAMRCDDTETREALRDKADALHALAHGRGVDE